jgi:DNA-binding NtrC family response regulator
MSGKVLFVDDQVDFLELLKIRLKNESYEKFFIPNTEEVLDLLEKEDIDVVVSDMNMPKNGVELFKELRKKYPDVVRIALSGSLNTNTLLMAINEGDVYKYIPKPWKVDEDGKNIIKSAINYSKFLKNQSGQLMSIEKLKEVLNGIDINFEIIEKKENIKSDYNLNAKYLLKIKK